MAKQESSSDFLLGAVLGAAIGSITAYLLRNRSQDSEQFGLGSSRLPVSGGTYVPIVVSPPPDDGGVHSPFHRFAGVYRRLFGQLNVSFDFQWGRRAEEERRGHHLVIQCYSPNSTLTTGYPTPNVPIDWRNARFTGVVGSPEFRGEKIVLKHDPDAAGFQFEHLGVVFDIQDSNATPIIVNMKIRAQRTDSDMPLDQTIKTLTIQIR